MNSRLYRIVFNRARGQLMAVQETAVAQGKSACGQSIHHGRAAAPAAAENGGMRFVLRSTLWAVILGMGSAHIALNAQIVADSNAAKHQQATVLNTANGLPQVNIQTPSAGGVSRNVFKQFDVKSNGAVLNNSRNNVQTQLGGAVQGNPWLARGEARLIVNEVNSTHPSQLKGFIEVAGKRADVIIANPAGINVDGAGFINASRATLTTGLPRYDEAGTLAGYRVQQGNVTVNGAGLDTSSVDFTELLARAVQVNAGIWAQQLNVVTGANDISSAGTLATTAGTPLGTAPAVAIDVAQLGGMYAGKITLIGTEAGVGARNAGALGAQAGELVVTVDGKLVNGGNLVGKAAIAIHGQELENNGTVYAKTLDVQLSGAATNRGRLAAEDRVSLTADLLESSEVLAAGVGSDGKLGTGGHLNVSVRGALQASAQTLAGEAMTLQGASIDLSAGQLRSSHISLTATQGDIKATNAMVAAGATLTASAEQGSQSLITDGATVSAAQLALSVGNLSNVNGELLQTGSGDTTISTGKVDNRGGRIAVGSQHLTLQADQLNNNAGRIEQAGNGPASLTITGAIDNTGGTIAANGSTTIRAASLSNSNGLVQAAGEAYLKLVVDDLLDNNAGQIRAGRDAGLQTARLENLKGSISAASDLLILATGAIRNGQGMIAAIGNVGVSAGELTNSEGHIASAKHSLHVHAGGQLQNSGGQLSAAKALVLESNGLENQRGMVAGANVTITSGSSALNNIQGQILASAGLNILSRSLDNSGGMLQARGNLLLDTQDQALINAPQSGQGGTIVALGHLTFGSGQLNNTGTIQSGGDLRIKAPASNQGGKLLAARNINIDAGAGMLDNRAGLISANGNAELISATLNNAGTLESLAPGQSATQGIEAAYLTVNAANVANVNGAMRADKSLDLKVGGSVDNTAGLLSSAGDLVIVDPEYVAAKLVATNADGTMIANTFLGIGAARLHGHGKLLSKGDLHVELHGEFVHGGEMTANGNLRIVATGNLINHSHLKAGQVLNVAAANIDNASSGEIRGTTTVVRASDTLTNRGLIDGTQTLVAANSVHNLGTGRLYGNQLAISATTLNNNAEHGAAAVIAARQRLDLGAAHINNLGHALIFSGGDMAIGASLDDTQLATGQAALVNNSGATIEALGDLSIHTAQLRNTNAHFAAAMGNAVSEARLEIVVDSQTWQADQLRIGDIRYGSEAPINYQGDGGHNMLFLPSAKYPWADWPIVPKVGDKAGLRISEGTLPFCVFEGPCATHFLYDSPSGTSPWAAFGVKQPEALPLAENAPCCEYDDACRKERSAMQSAHDSAYKTLDAKIADYNADLMSRRRSTWTTLDYTRTTQQSQVVHSDPAHILAGGSLTIHSADAVNDKSRIVAGGALSVAGGALNNIEAVGEKIVTDVGQSRYTFIRTHMFDGDERVHHRTPYAPPVAVSTVTLPITETRQYASPASQNRAPDTVAVGNVVQAIAGASRAMVTTPEQNPDIVVKVQATSLPTGDTLSTVPMFEIRSTRPNTIIPDSALFITNADSAKPLIETDPRFADDRQLLSSDYMLNALSIDPAKVKRRLGDGFYEQMLVREQIMRLTGRRYLGNHRSDEVQYKALMNAGVDFARKMQLSPGMQPSPQMLAQLTTDIDWLEEHTVTLADGTPHSVLVPKVYARVGNGEVDGQGTLLAGHSVALNPDGELINSGTIAGRTTVTMDASRIHNIGGTIAGDDVAARAAQDLQNLGGLIAGQNSVKASAGADLTVASTLRGSQNPQGERVTLDGIAGILGGAGGARLSAGNTLNLDAATIASTGETHLQANDINLRTMQTRASDAIIWDANNALRRSSSQEHGSTVHGASVTFTAQQDINARAAQIGASAGAASLSAGRDVSIVAGEASGMLDEAHRFTSEDLFSSTTTATRAFSALTAAQASEIGGQTVSITAGGDLKVSGSHVLADQDLHLTAAGQATLEAAKNTGAYRSESRVDQRGLIGDGGIGFTLGERIHSQTQQATTTRAAASTVGSINGDITIKAGQAYTQSGSDVRSPEGSIDISARSVNIEEARETGRQHSEQQFRQSGLTFAVTSPVIGAAQTAHGQLEAAGDTRSERMKALAVANAAISLKQAGDALATGPEAHGISVTIGDSSSQSTQQRHVETTRGSTVLAGNHVSLQAMGDEAGSDLTLRGSTLKAGGTTTLTATHAINLVAAQHTATESSQQDSQRNSVGIAAQLSNGGIGVTASASGGKGTGAGDSTTHTLSHVIVEQVVIQSGGDTTIKGGVVKAGTVTARVGGHLHIESPQDTSMYQEHSHQIGGSVTVGPVSGGSLSVGDSTIDSDYRCVVEQSAIRAGDGGFQIDVQGDTTLIGGQITSTQAAIDQGRNRFDSGGTVTATDLHNSASYSAESISVGLGTGTPSPGASLSAGLSGVGIGLESDAAGSVSTAGISSMAGNTAARTGDQETVIGQIFDRDRVRAEVAAQVAITQEFGKQASKLIGGIAEGKMKAATGKLSDAQHAEAAGDGATAARLRAEAQQLRNDWGDNGKLRLAAHTVIGGLTGGTSGAVGAAVGTLTAPAVAEALRAAGVDETLASGLTALASTTVGAATGGSAGAAAAFNEVTNNFLSHARSSRRLQLQSEQLACKTDVCRQEKQVEIDRLNRFDAWRDQQIEQACKSPASAECQSWTARIQLAANSYSGQHGNQVDTAERTSVLNQAYKYQQAANNPFLHGVGKGLLKLTPPGIAVGAVGGVVAMVGHIQDRGLVDGMIDVLRGMADIPQNMRDRLNSPDPTVRGEALVDVVALGAGVSAATAGGTRVVLNQVEKAKLNSAIAKAEAQALAKAKIENNVGRDGSNYHAVTWQELKSRTDAVRKQLPDMVDPVSGKPIGNAAVAAINVFGKGSTQVKAHSRIGNDPSTPRDGFVNLPPEEQRILKPLQTPKDPIPREVDTEFKILENFAQQYKGTPQVQGNINLFTERPPCASCDDVITSQFARLYPNVEVRVYHNNGEITFYKGGSAQSFVPKPGAIPQNPGNYPRAPDLETPKTRKKGD